MRNIREEIRHCRSQAEVDQYLRDHPIRPVDVAECLMGDGAASEVVDGRLVATTRDGRMLPTAFVNAT